MLSPWFAFDLWVQLCRAMLSAPWAVPLKVTEAAWGAQLRIARDLMAVSKGIGRREQPRAEAQSSRPQLGQQDLEAIGRRQKDAEEAIQRFTDFAKSQSRAVAGASRDHSNRAARRRDRVRAAAATSRTSRASVRSKQKQKKRRR
jgi:hypothetical protein